MSASLKLDLNKKLYVRDPEQTELGKSIISESVLMIDELGIEHFTFKKLALQTGTTEASIYRYFENKHKLLIYLVSCYWELLDYRIDYHTNNINEAVDKLKIIIQIITHKGMEQPYLNHVNESALYRIVIAESSKAYLTKKVDADNEEGYFKGYLLLCKKISNIIREINPEYPYALALVSTLLEAVKKQAFFAQHLPELTEAKFDGDTHQGVVDFLEHLAFSSIFSTIT